MITNNKPINSLSTPLFDSFLETILPTVAPTTAHVIIESNNTISISGIVLVTTLLTNETACEKKIIYRDERAAVLVSILKKYDKNIKLIGPPPIPKNDDATPKNNPIPKLANGFLKSFVLIVSFFIV